MEKPRHGRHGGKDSRRKHSVRSKKRKSREENGTSSPDNDGTVVTGDKPLVEYSDVSSEDLSGPEAGEIQSGEESVFAFSDNEDELGMSRNRHRYHRSLLEDEYYLARAAHHMMRSPPRRVHPELLATRSPSPPPVVPRERRASASSRSSPSSEVRARRKVDSSPIGDYRQMESPFEELETERRKRKRKEKKHKRDKKLKKKKKKSKHQSRSTSVDDSSDSVPTAQTKNEREQEPLSDWEAPVTEPAVKYSADKIDTSACSPVSNDSHIASPEPEEIDERHRTPSPASPLRSLKDMPPRESPHTPPLLPSRSYSSSHVVAVRDRSISPIVMSHERERSSRVGYVHYEMFAM